MDATPWVFAATVGAGVIGAARVATALTHKHRRRKAFNIPASVDDPTRGHPRPWIIMSPSKHEDPQAFKNHINCKARELGADHVHWRETTREDPGTGQAIRALEEGTATVIAVGGGGIVRAVVVSMAGSSVRMDIIPAGTGNVPAGNLSVPDNPEEALAVAPDCNHRAVDLAQVRIEDVTQESTRPAEDGPRLAARTALYPETSAANQGAPVSPNEPRVDKCAYLVVADMGYDDTTTVDTDPELRKYTGQIVYVWAGPDAMGVPYMKARLTPHSPTIRVVDPLGVDDQTTGGALDEASSTSTEPLRSPANEIICIEARSVMFANTGELKMPAPVSDAELSGDLIGVIATGTFTDLLGWADVTWKVLGQLISLRPIDLSIPTDKVAFRQAKGASVTVEEAQTCQVDSGIIEPAHTMYTRTQVGALDTAVPAEHTWVELLPD